LIIDARGRRCWGALSIVGDTLGITIPEKWLSEASYPVIVDPTVGTTTVGAFCVIPNTIYDTIGVYFNREFGLEKYILPDDFTGQATAYYYSANDGINNITPVMYSNNNNLPNIKLSSNENKIVFKYPYDLNLGWLSAVFSINDLLERGSIVWFGFYAEAITSRWDYGGSLVTLQSVNKEIFNYFPAYKINNNDVRYGLKLSMYFTYEVTGNNYSTYLSETARINDGKNIKLEYNRKCTQTIRVLTIISKAQSFFRKFVINASINMSLNGNRAIDYIGSVIDKIITETKLYIQIEYNRKCTQTMKIKTYISKTQLFFRRCKFTAGNSMWLNGIGKNKLVLSLIEKIIANSRLIAIKGISAKINDRVKAEGIVKRKLSVLLRIMTNAVVRSFINKRFLKATVEITLKSRIGEVK